MQIADDAQKLPDIKEFGIFLTPKPIKSASDRIVSGEPRKEAIYLLSTN